MVYIGDKKFACKTCIKGHRSSSCNHRDRALFAIRAKGRPVSQCEHCRELRKTKQMHVKCECDSKPPSTDPSGSLLLEPGAEMITSRKGAKKIKTLEPAKPIFPNGIRDLAEAAALLDAMPDEDSYQQNCTCQQSGICDCCTERYVPKKGKAKGHANRPSISLTIPEAPENSPSSPARSSRNHSPARSSHSRSPSRSHPHHTVDGHQAGGAPAEGHVRHVALYSPYSTDHIPPHIDALRSPMSADADVFGPSSAPSLLQAPSYAYRDLSAPSSPLSPDMDRPRSALSIQTSVGIATGRNTPVDYSVIPGSPSHSGLLPDWSTMNSGISTMGDGMQSMSLVSHSPIMPSPLERFMGASPQAQHQLSPVSAFTPPGAMSYRQQQEGTSPISPSTPQFMSPIDSSQPSPTTYQSLQDHFHMQSYDASTMRSLTNHMQSGFGGMDGSGLGDVFEADGGDGDVLGQAAAALMEHRSRRGSHQSIASDHSGHHLGNLGTLAPEIRLMSASPIPPPQPSSPSPSVQHDMAMPRPCVNTGNGCHCWSVNGVPQSENERCQGPDCACCMYLAGGGRNNPMGSFSDLNLDLDLGGTASTFAVSTERDAPAFPIPSLGGSMENGSTSPYSLLIPAYSASRTRSNSASSQGSSVSSHSASSFMANGSGGAVNNTASLSRANSTGQIGRNNGKYKAILPKPTYPQSSSSGDLMSYQRQKPPSLPTSNTASSPASPSSAMFHYQSHATNNADFTFPKPAATPALIVTQAGGGGDSFTQMMHSPLLESTGQDAFGGSSPQHSAPSSPSNAGVYPSLFDSMAPVAISNHQINRSHSRNRSTPSSFPQFPPNASPMQPQQIQLPSLPQQPSSNGNAVHGRSQSFTNPISTSGFLQAPRPQHHAHGRSSSTSMLDARFELVVTPASPFGAGSVS